MSTKFPRTCHLPWSPGGTKDDKRMPSVDSLLGVPLVVSEKLDGSNVCLSGAGLFARSHSGPPTHPSFAWLKAKFADLRRRIPPGHSLFCEYTFAVHTIVYQALPSYLWLIGVRRDADQMFLAWREVEVCSRELGIPSVPVIASGRWTTAGELEAATTRLGTAPGLFGEREGVVARWAAAFAQADSARAMGKFVRAGHVSSDEHWNTQPVRPQRLVAKAGC